MQERIYKTISSIVTAIILILGILFMMISYRLYEREAMNTMIAAADTAMLSVSEPTELYNILSQSLDYEVRITAIDSDGNVTFDSAYDGEHENHLDRPEIAAAADSGNGSAVRFSSTLSDSMYYYAVRTADGFIRFSRRGAGVSAVFIGAVPFFIVCCGLVMVVAVLASMKLAETIVSPVNSMIKSMNVFERKEIKLSDINGYEEFVPMVSLIENMRSQIREYIRTLSAEKNTIELIMANMTEGMILIDGNDSVISLNRSAADMLDTDFPCGAGRNIKELCLNESFIELVEQAGNVASVTGEFSAGSRYLRAFISSIHDEGSFSGTVILIVDETEIHMAEVMRREFSSNVSHELKTPLTTIRGFAEMLSNGMITGSEDSMKYGRRIYDESNRLLFVINDIIRLSEIEEKTGEIFTENNLMEIAADVAESLAEKAEEHSITLTVSGDSFTAMVSRGYIYELIYNLTENAVKYNRSGGRVLVTVKKADDKAVISVADNGIGIPKEHQARVFERFYRVDKSHSKQTGGTGLGLSIVKHITALHRGNITMESEADKGTVFTVMLPLNR